jgi:hypothetical protein
MFRDGGSRLWRSPLVWLAAVVIIGVLIFLHVRDKQLLASRSPDGQIQIRLLDRIDFMFDHDLAVTVNRAGHEQLVYTHLNDFCGPPRQGHVIWSPDSQSAAIFLCDGLCGPTLVLYDKNTNRVVDTAPADDKLISILLEHYKAGTPEEVKRLPWTWACDRAEKEN